MPPIPQGLSSSQADRVCDHGKGDVIVFRVGSQNHLPKVAPLGGGGGATGEGEDGQERNR